MVANAKRHSLHEPTSPSDIAEERALEKLNRLFAKAAPIAARKHKQALKRLRDVIAARIHGAA